MEHFEARLEVEVGSREAVAGNNLMSCSVADTEHFVDSTLAGNKASNRVPDEVEGAAADRNSRMDSEDMSDSASDAWVENSRAAGDVAHIDRAVLVLNRHLCIK
jgi:hypothetical protein